MSSTKQLSVVWQSRWGLPIGYSIHAEEMALQLDALGVEVLHRPTPWLDTAELRHPRLRELSARAPRDGVPQISYETAELFYLGHRGYKIGYTMLEVDGLPDEWVATCNVMDEIWTPSHWGAETFAAAGIDRPIYAIPLGYDPLHFNPDLPARRSSAHFTFLSVFEWSERKGPDLLLRAYSAAFTKRDDVLLLLRINNFSAGVDVARAIADMRLPPDAPPIAILYNQQIDAASLGSLYCSTDCFVLPTRGEGWGMPILEAMACGLPVIATNWSAQTEFFHAGVGYPLPIRGLMPASSRMPYYAGWRWAEPDIEHLVQLMRYVYEHPDEARQLGARAAQEAAEKWTWRRAAMRICERLEQIAS